MSGLLTGERMQYEVGEAVPKGGGSMKFGILSLLDHYLEDKSEEQYYQDFFKEVVYAEELGFLLLKWSLPPSPAAPRRCASVRRWHSCPTTIPSA